MRTTAEELLSSTKYQLSELEIFDYFKASLKKNRPRLIITIGIPGSGKSFFTDKADSQWIRINADELRSERLQELQSQKKEITLKGISVLPNPLDPKHIFSPELRSWVYGKIEEQLTEALKSSQNIILDISSINLARVPYIMKARQFNYFIEAIVFKPQNLSWNLNNIEMRVSKGGVDLAPLDHPHPKLRREQIIKEVYENYQTFLECLQVDRDFFTNNSPLDNIPDLSFLKSGRGSLESWMNNLSDSEKSLTKNLIENDIVNELYWIPVKNSLKKSHLKSKELDTNNDLD